MKVYERLEMWLMKAEFILPWISLTCTVKKSSPQFLFDGYLVEENKEKFMKIKDAYKILIDDQKREEYNNKIGKKFRGFLEFSLF